MAEIIAEPTALSKVIPLKFKINDVDVPKTTQLSTNKQFNTTDTDAWFTFELDGLAATNGTYDLTLINLDDKSIFHHDHVLFPTLPFNYKLNSSEDVTLNEIRHAGRWLGQLVVTMANGDTTARQFGFNIAGHILDGQDAQVILLSDYQALINTINLAKDDLAQYNVDYAALLVDIAAAEDARVTAYNQLLADQQTNIEAFDVALDEGIVAANLAQKLQDFEETNNSRLLSAEQQLAETIRIDESNLSLNNFNAHDRAVIQGLAEGEINAVLGLGNVERENIADKAVTPEKTSFIDTTNLLISNEVQVGKTIGTDSQVGDDSGRWLGGYIPVSSGEILSITPGSYRIQYYNKSRSPVGTRSGVSGGTFTVYVDSIIQFIRISGANSNQYDKVMLNRGSTLLPFQPYGILKKEHLPEDEGLLLGEVETENIADKAVTPEKTSFIDTTNLLISNEVQVGKTIGTDSQVGDDSGRWLGGYIPVSSGEILSITPGSYRIQYYNKSRSPVGTRSGVSGGTFTVYVDSIIQFIRISGANSNQYDKVMLNRGSTLLPFQPYGILKKEHLPEDEGLLLGEVETENIADKAVTPEKTSFIDTTNLLISNEVQVGKTIGTDSQVGDDSGRWLGGYIPVSSGEILSITPGSYRIQYYNKSRSPVGTRSGVSGGTFTVYVDSIIRFIRVSGANSNQYDKIMLNRGSTLLPFRPYGVMKKEYMPSDLQIDTDQIVAQVRAQLREEMKGQLTQYQPSFPKLTFGTVATGWSTPKWLSADGEVIYGNYGKELLQSFDEWETLIRIGEPLDYEVSGMRELGDGELLVSTLRDESINVKSKVFKTVGYDRNNPEATTFSEVLEVDSAQSNINNWWGFSVYDNIVTISDYGLKGAEGAKNVWVSTDYGDTFTMIFNQHLIGQQVAGAPPYTATAHMHTAAYDPYFNRIWVVVGDNPNTATYYSDDMGTSWTFVEGSTVVQYTGIIALPNAVLFGSDRNPNGVHVYHRGDKSEMPVIKPLLLVNDSKVITHVFQMPFKKDWNPATPTYFASEGISAAGGRAVVIGTVDGKTANLMFEADLSGPYSGNMHSPLGPTAQGNIVSYMEDGSIAGYRTVKAKAPTWSRV